MKNYQYGSREWCNQWAVDNLGSVLLDSENMTDSELFAITLEYISTLNCGTCRQNKVIKLQGIDLSSHRID